LDHVYVSVLPTNALGDGPRSLFNSPIYFGIKRRAVQSVPKNGLFVSNFLRIDGWFFFHSAHISIVPFIAPRSIQGLTLTENPATGS
jgi:hypothetical protein